MSERPSPRIAVTGLGAVSGFGWGVKALCSGLLEGRVAIGPFSRFDAARYPTRVAAEAPQAPAALRRDRAWPSWSWADRFAVAAAREAVAGAGWPRDLSGRRAGLFFGGTTGGLFEMETVYASARGAGFGRAPRGPMRRLQVSRPGEAAARDLGIDGPVETTASACASATLAIGAALEAIRADEVAVAIAGGADSLCRVTYGGFNSLRAVDERPCRPFRKDRAGLSLGEGAGALVLERYDDAIGRGAPVIAELRGAGASADAHHMTAPEPSGRGAALALRRAIDDAGLQADAVDLLNAHATGTAANDPAEFAAYERVFAERARQVPVLATKANVGHLLGGAGAIEAVATILALTGQRLQPAPGSGTLDPRTPLHLPASAEPARLEVAVSLNCGFGGANGALVVSRERA
jgi:3-oxoacyl-[acyl-carrier-protein] synthase II